MIQKKIFEDKKKDFKIKSRDFGGLDKKLMISGLIGISPIPIVGEIGMYVFIDEVLKNSAFSNFVRKGIATSVSILTRLYGIYPMYLGLYHYIKNF